MKKVFLSLLALGLVGASVSGFAATNLQLQHNKENVLAFYDELINKKDFDAASKYLGDHYTQHNPTVADGAEGLKGLVQFLKDKYPKAHVDIVRAFVQDDYVILHVHTLLEPETRGDAAMDIFKLDNNGKIIEHWDVIEAVPETSANPNGMF